MDTAIVLPFNSQRHIRFLRIIHFHEVHLDAGLAIVRIKGIKKTGQKKFLKNETCCTLKPFKGNVHLKYARKEVRVLGQGHTLLLEFPLALSILPYTVTAAPSSGKNHYSNRTKHKCIHCVELKPQDNVKESSIRSCKLILFV